MATVPTTREPAPLPDNLPVIVVSSETQTFSFRQGGFGLVLPWALMPVWRGLVQRASHHDPALLDVVAALDVARVQIVHVTGADPS